MRVTGISVMTLEISRENALTESNRIVIDGARVPSDERVLIDYE
jgi:hypothetical protein